MTTQKALWDELLGLLVPTLVVLPDKPGETPEATLLALWWKAYDKPKSVVLAARHPDLPDISSGQENLLRELIAQRLSGIPLAHLTGRQHFMGLDLLASPEALIPREETELLGVAALRLLQDMATDQNSLVYIDVCTGAGNLPVALASQVTSVICYAADLSAGAVRLTQKNIDLFNLGERVEVREGDLLAPFDSDKFYKKVDLLTCNPPYISSAKVAGMHTEISNHEPSLAFDGGPFGITILRRLVGEAPTYLKPGGWLAFEVGLGQGEQMVKLLKKKYDYRVVHAVSDKHGDIRAVTAQI